MNSHTSSLREFIQTAAASVAPLDLVLVMTLILLLLRTPEYWYSQSVVLILAVCGLAFRPVRESATLWLILAGFLGAEAGFHWYAADNHKYLECYWCAAIFGACSLPDGERDKALALNARMLIGLCMAFAVYWKAVSPTYFDHDAFFRFTLLTDPRFETLSHWLSAVPREVLAANRANEVLIKSAATSGLEISQVSILGTAQVAPLARFLTWWTVVFEALLAVVFLWPRSARPKGLQLARVRNALLLTFGMTTYVVATVREFGWLLMIVGLAQCAPEHKWARGLFFTTILLIQVFTLPFGPIVQSLW
jgi:hypothetical protein